MNRSITATAWLLLCGGTLGFLGSLSRSPAAREKPPAPTRSDVLKTATRVRSSPAVAASPRTELGLVVAGEPNRESMRAPLPAGSRSGVALDDSVMSGGTAARASLDRSLSATSTAQQSSSVVDAASQTGDSNTEVPAEGISASPSINVPFSSADGTAAATIPAALAETDPEMPVTQAERDGIAQLAEEFVARTEGGSQDSRNSARQRRWTQAQEESDIQMRTRYGGHAWLMRHRDAYRKALGNSPDRPDQGK